MPLPLLAAMGIAAAGNVINGIAGAISSNNAAKAQQKAAGQARGQITGAYNQTVGYQQPYYDIGTQNARTLSQMVNGGAFNGPSYDYQMQAAPDMAFNFEADPGYQWRMQQGLGAINAGAAAGGNQLSGATLRALQKYGQNLASQEYANAYDRYNTNRNFAQGQYQFGTTAGMSNAMNQYNTGNQQAQQRYNQFNNLAGMGQQAAGNLANMAGNYGNAIADTTIQGGNARAGGIMGQGQAWGNIANNLGQTAMLSGLMQGQPAARVSNAMPGMPNVDTNTMATMPYYG